VIPQSIFRQYDVRGLVGDELNPEMAHALGAAYATLAAERLGRAPRVAVGRDNRPSGAALAAGLREGLVAAGAEAVDVDMVPTPALYLAVSVLEADGGIQVTGSHNPPEFNGFKMVLDGQSLHGEDIQVLYRLIADDRLVVRDGGSEQTDGSILGAYRDAILARNKLARPVRVVVDCGNGVASLVATSILRGVGADVIPLFCESDGNFPNHHPDPTVPENLVDLQEEVLRSGAELGIAFDGDGDRIGAVDETGAIRWGDQLLVVFGRDAVRRFGKGTPVIFDVKCSDVLPRELERAGAKPIMWKTGHSLIKAKMKSTNAPLAGEMSGHIFFGGDYFGFDDAVFAAARLLEIISHGPAGLAPLLADIPDTFVTPEIRVDCSDDTKFGIVDKAAQYFTARYQVNTIDGVRIQYDEGWGLLRASNTQPVLVLRFEATNQDALERYRGEVMNWLREQGVEV
jgi:phosphomannomutase/phosphoglucomutase